MLCIVVFPSVSSLSPFGPYQSIIGWWVNPGVSLSMIQVRFTESPVRTYGGEGNDIDSDGYLAVNIKKNNEEEERERERKREREERERER